MRGGLSTSVLAVGAVLSLAACSSSGSGGASQSKLEAKLKSEPSIQSLERQGGAKATVTTQLVDCIAAALEKNASPSDLNKYVAGKLDLADIGGKTKGSAANAQAEASSCAKNEVAKDKSSGVSGH